MVNDVKCAVCDAYLFLVNSLLFLALMDMLSTPENAEEVTEQKKLDDLMTGPSGHFPGQPSSGVQGMKLSLYRIFP